MPELPEVETVLRTLQAQLQYPKIKKCEVFYDRLIHGCTVSKFQALVEGQSITDYHRHGKFLILELDDYYFISHLRMEGKYYIQSKNEAYDQKHVHAIFTFQNDMQLRYHDTRKFGRFYLYKKNENLYEQEAFLHIGKDVFDPLLQADYLYKIFHHRKITLKQALLNQSYMAGIGNIYADEICFALKYHPQTKVYRLTKKDFSTLLFETRRILSEAIASGGTTIRSYTSSLEVSGRFQLQLNVHMRKGEKCFMCGSTIVKTVVGGRGTYYCPSCQKRK